MQKTIVYHPQLQVIGLKIRTNNKLEFDLATAQIGPLIARYWSEQIADKIPHRTNPGVTIRGYFNYQSNEHGDYDYIIGEQVNSLQDVPQGLSTFKAPAGNYLKITSDAGPIPQIIIATWYQVWQQTQNNTLGGQRIYNHDFEVYDKRAQNLQNAVFDLYLGIQ